MITQNSYAEAMPIGAVGMPVNAETWNTITRTAEAAIGFGQPAFQGAADHGVTAGAAFTGTAVGAAGTPAPAGATITAAPAVAAGAKAGIYSAVCITAGATGKWRIEDPDGVYVGVATTGTEFVGGGLTFTITDSGTDPAVGEAFTITVTFTADVKFVGITEANKGLGHTTTPDAYAQYDSVAVRTQGVIWVAAGATVAPRDLVYWNPATSRFTNTATHVACPGWRFDSSAVDTGLVKIANR